MAEQIIRLQPEPPTKKKRIERRLWVRIPSERDVCCQKLPGLASDEADTGWPGKVRDVSTDGIALLLTRPLEVGTILILELESEPRAIRRVIEVLHTAPERDGHWAMGCIFASPLGEDELQSFLSEQQSPAA
jgi:hypothetical protein